MKTKRYLLEHRSTFLVLAMSAGVSSVAIAAPAKKMTEKATVTVPITVADTTAKLAPLSLIEVLAYALDHNPQRKSAWYAAKAAKFRIKTAKADGGLQVDLGGNASNQYGFGKVGTFVGGGSGGIGGGGFGGSSNQGWRESLSLDATLPIYTGGRVKGNKKVASYNYQAAVARAVGTEQDLVFSTTLNYLNILRSQQLVDVNQSNFDVAKERNRIANVRFNAGAAAKLEVFRANTDQATAQQNLVEAQNSLKQSYANLNTIMGREPQTPLGIIPIDELTLPEPLIANSVQLDRSTFTQGALSTSSGGSTTGRGAATGNFQTGTSSTRNAVTGTTLTAPRASIGNTITSPTLINPVTSFGNTTTGNTLGNSGTFSGNTANGTNSGTFGSSNLNGVTTTNTRGNSLSGSSGLGTSTPSVALASGQQLAQMANGSSPSLATLQAQVLAAEAAVGVAKAGKKPSLGLSLGGLISNPISYLGRFVVSLGGSLVQKLFDSGRTTSQVRDAQATVEQLKSSLQYGELNVANQIEQSLLTLNSSKEREVSTKIAVASAQEALRAAQLGYSAGVQTALDVSDAESALLTAQTNAVNSKFDVAASQAQLAAAVGVLTDEGQEAYDQSVPLEKVEDKKRK